MMISLLKIIFSFDFTFKFNICFVIFSQISILINRFVKISTIVENGPINTESFITWPYFSEIVFCWAFGTTAHLSFIFTCNLRPYTCTYNSIDFPWSVNDCHFVFFLIWSPRYKVMCMMDGVLSPSLCTCSEQIRLYVWDQENTHN